MSTEPSSSSDYLMRGQLFSFDFIFSVALLLLLFALSLFISDTVAGTINSAEERHELQVSASQALGQLLLTPGSPANWHKLAFTDSNVQSLGIAGEINVLDPQKAERFSSLANGNPADYALLKRILALDLPSADFSLTIANSSGFVLHGSALQPPDGASVYSVQRLALLETRPVLVSLKIWVEK